MSRGNQIVPVRMSEHQITRIEAAVADANRTRGAKPYDRSEWIRQAVIEKLNHLDRGRSRKPARCQSCRRLAYVQAKPITADQCKRLIAKGWRWVALAVGLKARPMCPICIGIHMK